MLHRYLLLFLLLTGAVGSARAQQESLASATFKQRLRAQYLHNDTAQAIINLYSKRQAGGASWIVAAALSATRLAIGTTTPQPANSYAPRQDNSVNPAVAFLVASPIMAYGVGKLAVYSNHHLETVLADYAAGKPLPRALRRKLAPRFFAQPIIQYEKVKVKPAN